MTRTATIVILVLVVLAAGIGAYYWMNNGEDDSWIPSAQEGATAGGDTSLESTTTLPTGSDTSDASLDTDLSSIDAQLGAFGSDSAAVGSSLNDSAVQQAAL